MKHLARILLLVFMAAIFIATVGCSKAAYQKGMRHYAPDDVATAIRDLKPLADEGDLEAQFKLGSLYYQGRGVPQDYSEAVKWLRKSAEQGQVFAQTTLGTIYAEGVQGVIEKDYPQALMWFIFAAAQGDLEAMEFRDSLALRMTPAQITEAQKLAREFKPQTTYAKAFKEFKTLAEQGDAGAQFKVGLTYYTGQGIPRDYLEALAWFKKAAQQGHPLAQYDAGYMYEKGEGTPQDYVEAAKYYRQAAEQGNQLAQYSLGNLYEKGQGATPGEVQVEVQALMWYNLASIQGESKAKMARERITARMTLEQIVEAQRLSREFKTAGK
jgi:uncharacterized protein